MVRRSTRVQDARGSSELLLLDVGVIDFDAPLSMIGQCPKLKLPVGEAPAAAEGTLFRKLRPKLPEPQPADPGLVTSVDDPLKAESFLGHHRRLEREEKRLLHVERERIAAEAEKISEQRALLAGASWRTAILDIVHLNDPKSIEESISKRKAALEEMDLFLKRYERMKRRDRANRGRAGSSSQGSSSESPETTSTAEARLQLSTAVKPSHGGGKSQANTAKLARAMRSLRHAREKSAEIPHSPARRWQPCSASSVMHRSPLSTPPRLSRASRKLPRGWHPRVVSVSGLRVLVDLRGRTRTGQRPKPRGSEHLAKPRRRRRSL